MKRLLLLFLASTSALLAQPTVPGTWTITGDVQGYPINETCIFTQDKDKITGSCKDSDGKAYDTTVTVTDKKVVFVHAGEYEGQALTLTYTGTYNDKGELSGDIDVQPLNYDGTFTILADKLEFAGFCEGIGVPTPPLFGIARDGVLTLKPGAEDRLDQDLFIKPVKSKGSRGIEVFRSVAPGRYRDESGAEIDRATLKERVAATSKSRALMVQQRLSNHPDIADLADQSLMAVRVITCKSGSDQKAIVTYAFIRIITRLEPAWPVTYELGIAVDLATGRLGPATGDKEKWLLEWWDVHPVTGAQVTGRLMPHWDEIKAIAVKAHNAARGRLLVGWDIAVTPNGPLVLEGNSYPDVDFPQRVCRVDIGHSPLGAPLHAALLDLERRIATGTVKRPPGATL